MENDISLDWSGLDTDWLDATGNSPVRERISSVTGSWAPAERRTTSREERARMEQALAEKARQERERARQIREKAERERAEEARLEQILAEGAREKREYERMEREREEKARAEKEARARAEKAQLEKILAEDTRSSRTSAYADDEYVGSHAAPEPETPRRTARPVQEPRRRDGEEGHAVRQSREPARTQRTYAMQPERAQQSERKRQEPAESDWEKMRAGGKKHHSGGGKVSVPIIILVSVLVIGVIIAGWQLGKIFLGYQRDRSAYDDLASQAISGLAEQDEASAKKDDEDDAEQTQTGASEVPISVDWDFLRSVNPDIVGWIYCPNTIINYPVVQTTEHEFYLDHGFDKKPNGAGTIFADKDSVTGVLLSNYIIYGHNMKDNSMFGTFQGYVSENYFHDNPTLYFLTPDRSYRVDLVCAHIVDSLEENFPTYFGSEGDYQAYINKITSNAFWVNRDALTTEHQMLTMSTCTYGTQYADARLLLHGMLVPIQ